MILSLQMITSHNLPTDTHIIQLWSVVYKMQKTSLRYLHKLLDILNLPGKKYTCPELLNDYVLGISTELQLFSKVQVLAYKIQLEKLLYQNHAVDTLYAKPTNVQEEGQAPAHCRIVRPWRWLRATKAIVRRPVRSPTMRTP